MTKTFPSKDILGVISAYMADLNSPISLSVEILVRYGEWDQIANKRVDPIHDYCDLYPEKFLADYAAVSFLRKCVDLPLDGDRDANAREKWKYAERRCFLTNQRFKDINAGYYPDGYDARINTVLERVKHIFRDLLGSLPNELKGSRHGPGSTVGDRSFWNTIPDKNSSRPQINSAARCLLPLWHRTAWSRGLTAENPHLSDPEVVDYDIMVLVDKDAAVSRPISLGPSISLFYQLGLAHSMREALKRRFGLELETLQMVHRRLACESSLTGANCTVDEISASDMVAREAVRYLSHPLWFEAMDTLRIPKTRDGSQTFHLEKFSAMGNGFTFELETVIFLSIAHVATEISGLTPVYGKNVSVYGDDIIVPVEAFSNLVALLKFFGFETNVRKSFATGSFRESCGGDYLNGMDVRPYFLEKFPSNPNEWISLANGINRVLTKFVRTQPARRSWHKCLDQLPSDIRQIRGPESLGDIVIHGGRFVPVERKLTEHGLTHPFIWVDENDRKLPRTIHKEGLCKWRPSDPNRVSEWHTINSGVMLFRAWVPILKPTPLHHWKPLIVLASALMGVSSDGPVPRRGGTAGYTLKWVPFS